MPRARGQIDEHKSDAILAAAVELFSTKGPATTMADIARAAGVSKQTLYNRYPNKSELARTLLSQRSLAITSPLGNDGPLEEALEGVAKGLIERVLDPHSSDHLRAMAMSSHDDPELARAVFEAGPKQSLSRIADWLSRQHEAGRLSVPNPAEAAEIFVGMVLGHCKFRLLLGIPPFEHEPMAHAREAARRFIKAYAP